MIQQNVLDKFKELFGADGDIRVYFAPGRVNLIGEHTDYNGGHVFPCALTIGTYMAARKRDDRKLRFYSMNFDNLGVVESSLDEFTPDPDGLWTNYPMGVMWAFEGRGMKLESGLDIVLFGNIPNGSGLSSSASLEVVTGYMLKDIYGFDVTNQDIALIGQYSENNYNGCNCGIMDQFASAMGKKDNAIFLDCNTLDFEYAPIVLDGAKIVVTNSMVKHSLVTSAYNDRRNESAQALKDLQTVCDIKTLGDLTDEEFEAHKDAIKDEVARKRGKHAVYENQRTIKAVKALKENDIETFGKLMNASEEVTRLTVNFNTMAMTTEKIGSSVRCIWGATFADIAVLQYVGNGKFVGEGDIRFLDPSKPETNPPSWLTYIEERYYFIAQVNGGDMCWGRGDGVSAERPVGGEPASFYALYEYQWSQWEHLWKMKGSLDYTHATITIDTNADGLMMHTFTNVTPIN